MKITHSDFKKGIVKLQVTDMDDLWYLSHIIDPGDFLQGKTTRKVKIGDGDNAKVAKKTLTLKIEAETIDFSHTGTSLRVNGKIKEGPEDIPRDSYHALDISEGTEFTLIKEMWLQFQKQKLQESSQPKYAYLICILDREEALIALTKKKGYDVLVRIKGDVPKKGKTTEIKKDFFQQLIDTLDLYAKRYLPQHIILASPAFYKEDLYKKISNEELKKQIVLASCSSVSQSALDEVIKSPSLKNVLQHSRARQEKMLVDELLAQISKDSLARYGWDQVKEAVDAGAVSKLLVTDIYLQEARRQGHYLVIDENMKKVDSLQGEIHIIASENESGKKLNGLGGIAAILRYRL